MTVPKKRWFQNLHQHLGRQEAVAEAGGVEGGETGEIVLV